MPVPSILTLQRERENRVKVLDEIVKTAKDQERVMTAEEVGHFERVEAELGGLNGQIEAATKDQEIRARMARLAEDPGPGRQTKPDAPGSAGPPAALSASVPATARRYGSLQAFRGADAESRAYRSGMWARAVLFNDSKAQNWCQTRGIFDQNLRNALAEGNNPSGGYLVPEEFSQAIIDLREVYGVFRKNARVIPMGRDTLLIPRYLSGLTTYFVGEGQTITDSTPQFNQVRLTAKKLAALCIMSTEVAEDAIINLGDWLARDMAYQFALKEDQCGFLGDGTSTYGGIVGVAQKLNAAGGLAGAVVAATGHDTFEEIDAADLTAVMAKLPAYARPNAKWYVSASGHDLLFGRLMIGAGGNTIQTIGQGYQPTYLGAPVVLTQVLPFSGDQSGNVMVLFGDLSLAATMGDRRDLTLMTTEHRYFETDQIAIRGTERFDINVHDVGTTTAAGPLVALVGAA